MKCLPPNVVLRAEGGGSNPPRLPNFSNSGVSGLLKVKAKVEAFSLKHFLIIDLVEINVLYMCFIRHIVNTR